jgi:hypothetical protein
MTRASGDLSKITLSRAGPNVLPRTVERLLPHSQISQDMRTLSSDTRESGILSSSISFLCYFKQLSHTCLSVISQIERANANFGTDSSYNHRSTNKIFNKFNMLLKWHDCCFTDFKTT